MSNGLRKFADGLGRALNRCLGVATPGQQQKDLLQQTGPDSGLLGLSDWSHLPHDSICVQDSSGSMTWRDCDPCRLEVGKRAAEACIRRRAAISPTDRIGIVTFNNHGRVVLPLTEVLQMDQILLLTDGQGGQPLGWATHLKNAGVLLEVIGLGGDTSAVDQKLCRQVATTDANGFTHYWFFRDADGLIAHYENLASGLVYGGHGS